MDEMTETHRALDGIWESRADHEGRVHIWFLTHFASADDAMKAFGELSVTGHDGKGLYFRTDLAPGVTGKTIVQKDRGGVAFAYLTGRFSRDQAMQIVTVFGGHTDHRANDRYLAEMAAKFGTQIQQQGSGGLVWLDWPEPAKRKLAFWR
jgi:hypothetical protein